MSKEHLQVLAELMAGKGITQVVVSPGSRNAPAIIVFNRHPKLKLHSISDERSAGFYALGIAMQSGETVALLCTSGSAALNYAPAISEAWYQKVPLLVITADRPTEWIDQGDGQTIRQSGVYNNFIRKGFQLPADTSSKENQNYFNRMVCEAIDRCHFPANGPVHLNLPLKEPLYDIQPVVEIAKPRIATLLPTVSQVTPEAMQPLAAQWNRSVRKLILVGQLTPQHPANIWLSKLSSDPSVIILSESTSNLDVPDCIECIDRTIEGIDPEKDSQFSPDILLSIGGAVVSKKIKGLLRRLTPHEHWHVNADTDEFHMDTYRSLTCTIPVKAENFLNQLAGLIIPVESNYRQLWQDQNKINLEKHLNYIEKVPFCDLKAYEILFKNLPADGLLHLGNSTPVRYGQLFDELSGYPVYSNRGTSGIDGCVSTAAGAAAFTDKTVTIITGDVGFLYDSNALWNSHLPSNLRIVVLNNGGGNIFRVISGPDQFAELEPFIETKHQFTAEGLACNFDVKYYQAKSSEELRNVLEGFFSRQTHEKPALLEIFTPNKLSAQVLKDYFKFIAS